MRIIKKLDIFILKGYLQLFAGTFFICLFIFMMQFMWRYVDELIGKGLSTEVLMKFFSCCETLDIHTDEHLKAWLLRVAVNLSKNIIKSARWRKNVPQDDDYQAEFLWNESELDVKQALDKLPNEYRAVIYLYYYEGYKTTEIAQILELPKGTVVSRLDRARKKLGTLLADYGKESMA